MFNARLSPMQRSSVTKILLVVFLVIFLFGLLPRVSQAQSVDLGVNSAAGIGLAATPLKVIIARIIQIILGFLGILTVALIIYAGFIWMTAADDPEKIARAKKILVNAIIGLIIILAAFIIVSFILRSFEAGAPGGGGNRPPGPPLDFGPTSRDPIESTYPANDQKDVPINTMIAVTFREKIAPDTICETNAGSRCNGEKIKNVTICKLQDGAQATACETTGDFTTAGFTDTKVYNNDDYTYVFMTYAGANRKYLGLEDKRERVFRVMLGQGIMKADKSGTVFVNSVNRSYNWHFTTNGELDLDPPEILSTNEVLNNPIGSGIYPGPDDLADTYNVAAAATKTRFTFDTGLGNFNKEVVASASAPVRTNGDIDATIVGQYGGTFDGPVNAVINGNQATVTWPAENGGTETYGPITYAGGLDLNLGPSPSYGLSLRLARVAAGSNSWTFNVVAAKVGDRVQVLDNGNPIKTYVIGRDIAAGTKQVTLENIVNKIITDNSAIFETCSYLCIQTKNAGEASGRYNIKILAQNTSNPSSAVIMTRTAGANTQENIIVNGLKDAYRNTKFQITFNEAVNPLVVSNIIVRYDRDYDGNFVPIARNNINYKIANNYRTIELTGNIECGINACGDKIYCWPVNSILDTDGDGTIDNPSGGPSRRKATHYEVETPAANLKTCAAANENWCTVWGGTCTAGAVCSKTVTNQKVFYPKTGAKLGICGAANENWCTVWGGSCAAGAACSKTIATQDFNFPSLETPFADGMTDMALNSFNGSFNYFQDTTNQKYYGLADGQRSTYNQNLRNPDYEPSALFGDNFKWSFWVSDKIDLQSPLLQSLTPTKDQDVADPLVKPKLTFNKVMSFATLKPGYLYGQTEQERNKRYILLDAVTNGAWLVGYSINSYNNIDSRNGEPTNTYSEISHSKFSVPASYAPLAGSGIESITQNCFLPGSGPQNAGSGACAYINLNDPEATATTGCVSDTNQGDAQVKMPNPASYATLYCDRGQINGAKKCDADEVCRVFQATSTASALGSWVISRDHPAVLPAYRNTTEADNVGRTDCCYGKCCQGNSCR